MKKIFTLMAAATAVLAASAGTHVLVNQNFETTVSAADEGWSYGGASMDIISDEFGKYLQLTHGQNNGRNAQLNWGTDVYGEGASFIEDGVYTVKFDYCPKQSSNNQYNSGITLISNLTPPANQPFLGRWTWLKDAEGNNIEDISLYQGYLFDLLQVKRETEDVNSIQFQINGDAENLITLNSEWNVITLVVDVNARTVEYEIVNADENVVASGVRIVPETECDGTEISMYATGLWVMVARYQTLFQFDNIMVSCQTEGDYANAPTAALTGVGKDAEGNLDLTLRTYTVSFMEEETLHVKGADGVEETVQFDDCDGNYKYITTTSGTFEAWTTQGDAESTHIFTDVDCTPILLPEAEANVISVAEGYAKTYKLTVDNSKIALTPVIYLVYEFIGDNGEVVKTPEGEESTSGVVINVTQPGKLTITTKAFGYQQNTVTLRNDVPYNVRYSIDFARMSAEEIAAVGFTKDEDLNSATTSGEQNWTARKRIFYYDAASAHPDEETGETVYDAVYPIGFVAEDDTEHVLHRYIISADEMTEEKAASLWTNFICWNGLQAKMLEHIGLIQDTTTNNYNAVTFTNCGASDIVVVNTVNDYGSNSVHPICNNDAEFWAVFGGADAAFPVATTGRIDLGKKTAGAWVIPVDADGNAIEDETVTTPASYNLSFNLYRVDTALTKATVYYAGESGIEGVAVDSVKNVDNSWYTIDGLRYDAPTHSGLYIHQGKKVYIRK